jgi:iron complex transport system substrate-binding protein
MNDLVLKVTSYAAEQAPIQAIRTAVFQNEQGVDPALEFDGEDAAAQHILAYLANRPVGTARIRRLTPQVVKLERVAVLPQYRGRGVGKQITLKALDWVQDQQIGMVKIHAQTQVQGFYEKLGFETHGAVFEEAGIPHVEMTRVIVPRIVSLIPSATEIVAALGLTDCLVARSHECDYPASVQELPACTQPKFDPEGSSSEIHDRVTKLLQTALSVYQVDTQLLETLQPTHILTQAQCEVCAVSLGDVEQAVATLTHNRPRIISLQPRVLEDLWQDMRRVGTALQVNAKEVETAIASLQTRVEQIQDQTQDLGDQERPAVGCIEWSEPLMAAGNWIPQLVHWAGGKTPFGAVGEHSPWMTWEELTKANPDVLVLMPCGYDLEKTRQDAATLQQQPQWSSLRAVQSGRVYITDGNQYFNRPGPRLVDSLEILAEIFHPSRFQFGYEGNGWMRY